MYYVMVSTACVQFCHFWGFFAPVHVVGTELCTVVETMYSYKMLFSVIGDPIFGK